MSRPPRRPGLATLLFAALLTACTAVQPRGGQCAYNADCEGGLVCAEGACRAPCGDGGACPEGMRCSPVPGTPLTVCVAGTEEPRCNYASDCASPLVCNRDGRCRAQCRTDYDCRVLNPFTTCVEGSCALVCGADEADCDGQSRNGCEADLRGDDRHCGTCGNTCRAGAHQSSRCAARRCEARCDEGWADCDNNAANGCEADLTALESCGACGNRCVDGAVCAASVEGGARRYACATTCAADAPTRCGDACVDTRSDVAHCGACGNACAAGPNAEARCVDGRCALRCTDAARYADCDGAAGNGCEAELPASASHCGACGTTCAGAANADGACAQGQCGLACQTSFGNCDGDRANGCEADLRTELTSCGMCGMACSAPANARPTCADGRCGFACDPGFADCDNNPANGCEADTRGSAANCGACGARCAAGLVCSAGACASNCPAGQTVCDGACADLASSVAHCGTCGRACAVPANAAARCASRACTFACEAGFGDCDGNAANGCETSLNTSATSCGACGTRCALANATSACAGGRCVVASCAAGFGDCDGDPANGCEVSTASAPAHCGACNRACAPPNGVGACAAGVCRVATCSAGFGDCDGNAANGCEVSLASSVTHCGACGALCSNQNGTPRCGAGRCEITCARGFGDCDGNAANGCETSTDTSVTSCGACGRACSLANATASCSVGRCAVARCNAGFGDCDGDPANGCETNLATTPSSCGVCGRVCALANATATCAMGSCAVARCNAGFGDCDGDPANGCEVNLNTTVAACGACGRACAVPNASPSCAAGVCGIARCNTGFGDCDSNPANGCEVDLSTRSDHCGACGAACGRGMVCSAGRCTTVCASPTTNCSNACVNLATDVANCGACGNRCPTPANAAPTCARGACGGVCAPGFGDCNANLADGCETNTATSAAHCGGCGRTCAPPNATGSCAAGSCGIARCNPGFGDCDGNPANGCETNLNTAAAHCGRCGGACSLSNATAACSAGVCAVAACNAGYGNCDGNPANGCETALSSTAAHCGACGAACSAVNGAPVCRAGTCAISCAAGFGNCDGDARSNGCETGLGTPANCGGCGVVCSYANAAPLCVSLTGGPVSCRMGACGAGYADCDASATTGCEVNTAADSANCGMCGRSCALETRNTRGVAHTCQESGCRPQNDTCANAEVINLAAGPRVTLQASNRYARRELGAPCQGNTSGDVWFRFTLTQRELVYADTFSASWDTVLFFATGCNAPLTGSTTVGDAVCNDDASGTCANDGTRSQVVALLEPGTYYLVLAGYSTNVGEAAINVEHLPVGNGALQRFPVGAVTTPQPVPGSTGGTGQIAGVCGGAGPEVSYWWRSCSADAGGRYFFHTCTTATNFDTVLYLRGGNTSGDACNDDDAAFCSNAPTRSRLLGSVPAGAGLHVLTLDGYNSAGSFELRVAYPYTPIN
jgi:hypothetical protein